MARDFDGVNDQISFATVPAVVAGATVLSFSAWVWQDNVTQDHAVFDFSSGNQGIQLYFDDVGSVSGRTNTFKTILDEGVGIDSVSQEWSTNAGVQNAWQHIFLGMEAASATGLQFWISGIEDALSPVSLSALADFGNTTNTIVMGQDQAGNRDRDGRLAEVAFWNRILTDPEIIALSKGFSPLCFPVGLLFYATLIGRNSPERDIKGGIAGTLTGTSNIAHPRIIYPRGMR